MRSGEETVMSIDIHSEPVTRVRCEAVTLDAVRSSPCIHTRLTALPHSQSGAANAGRVPSDDTAVLIGLALSFVRQGSLLDGTVPEPLMVRLRASADHGNPACRLLLDWLQNRNRHFWDRSIADVPAAAQTPVALRHRPRRSPRERMMAAAASPTHAGGIRHIRMRPHDPVYGAEAEIVAPNSGGRVDG